MAESVTLFLGQYLSPELVVFIISMLPILELRGGLIAASIMQIPWSSAIVLSVIGTILPIPVILLFVRQVLRFMIRHNIFGGLARWIENKGMTKGAQLMEKHPRRIQLALFLFVAIPLPGTGAWTGSLIASLFGIKIRHSLPAILLGVLGAAAIMSVLAYLLPSLIGLKAV